MAIKWQRIRITKLNNFIFTLQIISGFDFCLVGVFVQIQSTPPYLAVSEDFIPVCFYSGSSLMAFLLTGSTRVQESMLLHNANE